MRVWARGDDYLSMKCIVMDNLISYIVHMRMRVGGRMVARFIFHRITKQWVSTSNGDTVMTSAAKVRLFFQHIRGNGW